MRVRVRLRVGIWDQGYEVKSYVNKGAFMGVWSRVVKPREISRVRSRVRVRNRVKTRTRMMGRSSVMIKYEVKDCEVKGDFKDDEEVRGEAKVCEVNGEGKDEIKD